jgi:PAS domain S-box-containing protein/diguanylate cyclase (GGDEF)-like protein
VTRGKAQIAFFGRRAAQSRALQPPFLRSPALLVMVYFAAAAVCTLLISRLPRSLVQFGLVGVGARTGSLWLDTIILTSSAGLLIVGLAKRLSAAAEAAGLALTERDVAVGVIDILGDAVLVADIAKEGEPIIYVNRAFEEITGYSAAEARGKNCRYLQGSDRLQPEIAIIRSAIEQRKPASVTLRNYRKSGQMFWNQLRLTPAPSGTNAVTHYIGTIRNVTANIEAATALQRSADLDTLTSVANRTQFRHRLESLISHSTAAFLLLAKVDVARFYEINTHFGHQTGDALLVAIGKRLGDLSSTVGRLGADEFALAVELASSEEAEAVVARIRTKLEESFILPGAVLEARFAIGFALDTRPRAEALTLLRQAGVALHESRLTQLRTPRGYDHKSELRLRNRARLTSELQQAVLDDGFVMYYQPKVTLENGHIIGAEALIRWQHPVFGMQPPDLFIPIAEETGLIVDIGASALRKTMLLACEINTGRSEPIRLSVNVSFVQFLHRDMLRLMDTLLGETGADPRWITLELTESVFAEVTPELLSMFLQLRERGIGLAIDDFGTGYSGLRYLETFPLSEIKLDKSFVSGLRESHFKQIVVEAIVKVGHTLNADVTAEGVETASEASSLRGLGCPWGQGFFFSRPLPEQEFIELIRNDRPIGKPTHAMERNL